jgi:outer membrane protein TolC
MLKLRCLTIPLLLTACATRAAAQGADTLQLSIEAAVERSLRSADEARQALAQLEVTEAQVTVARAGALPTLRLNSTYTRQIENARAQAVGQIFNQPNTYNVNANITQPLFQGGRVFAATRAAGRLRRAARLDVAEVRAQLTLDVQRAYLQALFSDRLVQIQAENLSLASARLTQVQQLEGGGRAARYDVLRARVERANLEPQLLQARNDRELALLELKRLLNIPVERPIALTTSVDAQALPALLASYERDSTAQAERASVRSAELVARARRDAIAVARADLLPTVNVFFQTGYQAFPVSGFPTRWGEAVTVPCSPGSPSTCRPTTTQNNGFFSDRLLGVQISWPLFDGLRAKGNIDLAQAQTRLAETQLNLEREQVALEVAQARAELARARAAFGAQQLNGQDANEAFRLASLRFTRGVGTQLDVSDAQLALLTAQTNEARAVYDLYLASASLAFALGRPIPFPPSGTSPTRTTLRSDAPTSPRVRSDTSAAAEPDSPDR